MNKWRHTARWVFASLLCATGAIERAKRDLQRRRAVMVLMLHRVLDTAQFRETASLEGMVIRTETFSELVAHCATRYEPADAARLMEPGTASLSVGFTFDDGWTDTFENAVPILARGGFPVTVFVCPGLAGRRRPFWPERAAASLQANQPAITPTELEREIERLKQSPAARVCYQAESETEGGPDTTMNWEQITTLAELGVVIGSHTNTHPILTMISEEEARCEAVGSKRELEKRLGMPCLVFAYPNGGHSEATRRILADSGYALAFTTTRGAWIPGCDPLAVPRLNIWDGLVTGPGGRFSAAMFEYSVFWKGWRALRALEVQ